MLPRGGPPDAADGDVLQVHGVNLADDFTTTATAPVYAPLLALSLTPIESVSFVDILFYAAYDFIGLAPATNARINVRFRLNGALIAASRAASSNQETGSDHSTGFCRRLPLAGGGLQTVTAEIAIVTAGATIEISAASRPDEHGAHLRLRETRE